ncbi:MAG: hypothetical protein Q4D76_18995 [Oscillospiraceae bacterium]|nr:hypothetical protein [Oscillospiraceae bacterium]
MEKKQNYDVKLHEPLGKRNAEAIQYWLDHGKKLKIDSNYHVYFGNRWIGDARPKRR